ncbi:MAG TPA: ABC transporter permease [Roseiflexaceae bacterium]|nr:ABC transporter permease [Roseiflexaceae bacterium]
MLNYIARRVVNMIVLLVVVSFVGFWIIQLPPGSILDVRIAQLRQQGGNIPESMIQALRARYGVDDPFLVQYWKWISRSFQGDFGTSFETDQSVAERIYNRLGISIGLSLTALLFTWLVSIPIGVYSATHRYTWPDYLVTFVQFLGLSIPGFLLALILLIVASRLWDQPIGGLFSQQYADAPWSWPKVVDFIQHVWIAVVVLAFGATAGLTRVMRANLLDVLNAQYIQTARAKGLQEAVVIWKHAVRNAIHPLVMSLGTLLPALVVGETLIAIILSMPTIGPLYLDALRSQDMYLAGTILVMLSALLLLGNLFADLLLAWVDPRVRLE